MKKAAAQPAEPIVQAAYSRRSGKERGKKLFPRSDH